MIILDTNVLSELIRPQPSPAVVAWLSTQPRALIYTTAITRGEMLFGAHVLPTGQRKNRLLQQIEAIFTTDLAARVLPYDAAAAEAFAGLMASRRSHGRPVSQADGMIAGIVRSRGATLATRNVRDFDDLALELVNPWH